MPQLYAALLVATLGFLGGFTLEHSLKNGEIATINDAHDREIIKAQTAQQVAEKHASELEHAGADNLAAQAADYERKLEDEKIANSRVTADLRSGAVRLRVALANNTCGSNTATPTASTSGGNGDTSPTLAGPVAARLADRYAAYNTLVRQLTLAQETINQYLVIINAREYPSATHPTSP
jgi:hypothetical protein